MPRFDKNSGVILIMTRWHVDDPVGRFIEQTPGVRVLRYPAIAEDDEGLPHRGRGEPLFPGHKPLDFLLEQKQLMSRRHGRQNIDGADNRRGGILPGTTYLYRML